MHVDDGATGRELRALRAIGAGERLFEEEPAVITPTGQRSMHRARWRAYLMLRLSADERCRPLNLVSPVSIVGW